MQFDSYITAMLASYLEMMEPITPMFHLAYAVLLNRLVFFGNRFRATFGWFVTFHYIMFLFLPSGWLWVQLGKSGPASFSRIIENGIPFWFSGRGFGLSGLHFVLTISLITLWFSEAKSPKNDYDFRKVRWWNFWVVPLILWGFIYPFSPADGSGELTFLGLPALWRSSFGVLINPTSTFLLGLLTLIYPRVNFKLFLGSSLALLVLAAGSIPFSPLEWPLGILALYNIFIGSFHLIQKKIRTGLPAPNSEGRLAE